jgi:acyl transferase domain-containing protein/acyl carrier protein
MDESAGPPPIAVVGVGCRFPGADGPVAFWQLLKDGVDAITDMPTGRFDLDALYDPRPRVPGKVVTRQGGFLRNLDQFDPDFFGISPREAHLIDPQQRLLLEACWEAFEDAGIPREVFAGTRTGVFVGMWTNEYEDCMYGASSDIDLYVTTGGGRYSASGRLSYVFDLQGPSLTVDTACSSSLVAVHLACQSLWRGESALALAGGVNLILQPHISIGYSRSGMLSPDARCKFADAGANGYVRSEGAGVVLLKPCAQAVADGDPIYALIRGTAVNNDGHSSGLLVAPSSRGQEVMLRDAYRSAGVRPGQVQYMEAHGTGTSVGDPVELEALGSVLSIDRPPDRPCLIGSVKTNIGHTEAASGIAGLIKVALCLKHRLVPPSLHVRELNPRIPWNDLPLVVARELQPWPPGPGPALAGVNSFGVTGTNAHIVLQEAPAAEVARGAEAEDHRSRLLPLSARSPAALAAVAGAWRDRWRSAEASLPDLTYTAAVRRTHHEHRVAVVGRSTAELADGLDAFARGEPRPNVFASRATSAAPRVVFVFPGQGSQWLGMGRQVLQREPTFRAALDACDRAVREESGFSVLEELAADASRSRLDEIDVIQPTLFSIQVALAALWRSWGIEPAAMVGHSMGEVAAAHVAGVLGLEDAARVICRRSRLLRRARGRGAMAVVDLSLAQAGEAIAGYEDRLSVAVSNSSRSSVLSGDPAALDEVIAALEARDVFCRRVKVDVASHSPQMDALRADLIEALDGLHPRAGHLPLYSTVTGEVGEGAQMGAAYWARNLREPVLFSSAVGRLVRDGHSAFVEVSAHPILLPAIQQELQYLGHEGAVLPSLCRDREEGEEATLLESLGALYALGAAVDWKALHPAGGRCLPAPSYPWQRERFWYDGEGAGRREKASLRRGGHPLLGPHLGSSTDPGAHFWETELGVDVLPWLDDHRVDGVRVCPAAACVEMALAAAGEAFGGRPGALSAVSFERALVVPETGTVTVQVAVSCDMPGAASFRISSLEPGTEDRSASWTLHAKGTLRLDRAAVDETPDGLRPEAIVRQAAMSPIAHYQAMATRALHYGPSFQGVAEAWSGEAEVWGRLAATEAVRGEAGAYRIHPALLDAGFQLLVAAAASTEAGVARDEILVPVGLEQLWLGTLPAPEARLWGRARVSPGAGAGGRALVGDVALLDEQGRTVLEVRGLRLEALARPGDRELDACFFALEWEAARPEAPAALPPGAGRWLILAGRDPVGDALAALLAETGESVAVASPGSAYARPEPGRYRIDPERPEDFRRLLAETGADGPWRGVVHLWGLDADDPRQGGLAVLREAQVLGCASVLHLVQALAGGDSETPPRLWLVHSGTQRVDPTDEVPSIAQAPLWGMGRVVASEHPELRCTAIDLSPPPGEAELRSLRDELRRGSPEDQVALRGEARYVARLVRRAPEEAAAQAPGEEGRPEPAAGRPFRASIAKPGMLDNLRLEATPRREPGPGQVEIEVHASGLNFMNVMSALGVCPGAEGGVGTLGLECAGRISAVGDGVPGFQVDDEVLAVANDSLASHARADARMVAPKPARWSFEEAAAVPIVFLTAHYALTHLARLQRGERVLIHAAAGGVGLAALQIAQRAGAEIFATAGSAEKRALLRSLGVSHVMDSRSLAFADEVRDATGGEGVDVVLNSLAGEAISRSLDSLRPFGRFLEIGKRDIHRNAPLGLAPFRKSLSYFAIDLDRMIRERPELVGALLREVMALFESKALSPIPHRTFPVGDLAEAFRHMAQARHTGKIVLRVAGEAPAIEAEAARPALDFSEGTYLITGGLGGLGLEVAGWMAARGARHVALVGRSGLTSAAKEATDALTRGGVEVRVVRADVTDEAELARALAEVETSMPPLRGVVHAAGVLDDASVLRLDRSRLDAVMGPKVAGAWNLHTLTAERRLDHFVLFSSAMSLLGSPGQANYAAGNAFLDALAAHRRARGVPALAVSWGPWSDVGLAAARADRGARLARRGLGSLRPEQGLAALGRLLRARVAHSVVMPFDAGAWCGSDPAAASSPLLARLAREQGSEASGRAAGAALGGVREALLAVEPGRPRRARLESHLRERVAQVLRLVPGRVDWNKPLRALGLDSLMGLELRNRLEADLGLKLPATLVWNHPTVAALVPNLAERMGIPLGGTEPGRGRPGAPGGDEGIAQVLDEIEKMTAQEAQRLLAEGMPRA